MKEVQRNANTIKTRYNLPINANGSDYGFRPAFEQWYIK